MFAAHHRLDRVIAIVDHNGLQIDGRCQDVMNLGEIAEKFRAFGWNVLGADGHDIASLLSAFAEAKTAEGAPTVVVCLTHKGRGVSFMEDNADWHGKAPSAQECETAADELCQLTEGGGR
jgi:transketolase